jgi:hypothetical protein
MITISAVKLLNCLPHRGIQKLFFLRLYSLAFVAENIVSHSHHAFFEMDFILPLPGVDAEHKCIQF